MEISSLQYFTFWSVTSIAFSIATAYSLSLTTIRGRHTITYFFLLSVNCCISYTLLYTPAFEMGEHWIDVPAKNYVLWPSSPVLHIAAWSWVGITYLITGAHALGLILPLPHTALYVCVLFTSCSMYYAHVYSFRRQMEDAWRRDKINHQFLIYFVTMYAPLVYLASISDTKLTWDSWIYEVVMLTLVPAASAILNAAVLIPVMTSFAYYCTLQKFSARAIVPLLAPHNNFLCWVLIQCLFMVSFRVGNKLHFLRASQTGFISYSLIIPSLFSVCSSLFEGLVAKSAMVAKAYQQRRIAEIIFGVLATVVAQYYTKVQSLALLFSCLFMALAWLGNIANVEPATDFGIFQFFVTAAVQCAGTLYGLHFYTFLVAGFVMALMILRSKMETVLLI